MYIYINIYIYIERERERESSSSTVYAHSVNYGHCTLHRTESKKCENIANICISTTQINWRRIMYRRAVPKMWKYQQIIMHYLYAIKNKQSKCRSLLVHVMKVYRGSRRKAPLTLNLGTKWKWSVSRPSRCAAGEKLGTN